MNYVPGGNYMSHRNTVISKIMQFGGNIMEFVDCWCSYINSKLMLSLVDMHLFCTFDIRFSVDTSEISRALLHMTISEHEVRRKNLSSFGYRL